jgi:transposase
MMEQLPPPECELFYAFSLEQHVPQDHLWRQIDAVLDPGGLRAHLGPYYRPTGRPSVDPQLMIRMLIVGYCYAIRSERRLCEEVHLNLAYRWFCRLGLEGAVPDHSTFSKNRHGRFRESEAFRFVFDEVVHSAMAAGLVKGEGFTVDARRQRGVAGSEEVDRSDPKRSTRAVREYLSAVEAEALAEASPKNRSLTDPLAQWAAATGGSAFDAYSTNYLIDTAWGIILDVEATPAHRTAEVEVTKTMLERIEACFDLTPERYIGDTAYGAGPMLAWLVEENAIAPLVPV